MGDVIMGFVIMILFSIAAIFLLQGKGAWMIAGYNMYSETEKAHYDESALCKFVGKLMLVIVLSIGLLVISDFLSSTFLFVAGITLMIGTSVCGIVYMNTKKRFKKKHFQ